MSGIKRHLEDKIEAIMARITRPSDVDEWALYDNVMDVCVNLPLATTVDEIVELFNAE